MDATHLHCPRCRTMRPIRFEPLLAGEQSLGTSVYCAHCSYLAFTLIKPARFYCEICDDVQPALLERVELRAGGSEFGVLLVCAGCFDGKTLLCAVPPRSRSALAGRKNL
jgi:hypothetical protein